MFEITEIGQNIIVFWVAAILRYKTLDAFHGLDITVALEFLSDWPCPWFVHIGAMERHFYKIRNQSIAPTPIYFQTDIYYRICNQCTKAINHRFSQVVKGTNIMIIDKI